MVTFNTATSNCVYCTNLKFSTMFDLQQIRDNNTYAVWLKGKSLLSSTYARTFTLAWWNLGWCNRWTRVSRIQCGCPDARTASGVQDLPHSYSTDQLHGISLSRALMFALRFARVYSRNQTRVMLALNAFSYRMSNAVGKRD